MRAFKPVDISEICLPSEACEWLAFGRIPELWINDYGSECRDNLRFLLEEEYSFHGVESSFCSREEFNALDIDGSYDDYFKAAWDKTADTLDELFNGPELERSVPVLLKDAYGPPSPSEIESVLIYNKVRSVLEQALERAQLSVLLALMEGRITAYGYKLPERWGFAPDIGWVDENGRDVEYSSLQKVAHVAPLPQSTWRNDGSAFEYGDNDRNPPGYMGVWLQVKELLEVFPEPFLPKTGIQGAMWGSTIIDNGEKSGRAVKAVALRGRPKKGGGIIERAVRNEFGKRIRLGNAPDKKESLYQECIEWVAVIFDEQISRSAAQRYLSGLGSAPKKAQ